MIEQQYELSVWEDTIKDDHKIERKLAIISTNKYMIPISAYDVTLKEEINGEKTLTFTIARQFNNEGFIQTNPFLQLLVAERHLKLRDGTPYPSLQKDQEDYEEKWHDFVIKEISENKKDNTNKYTCKELFVNELGKNGYSVILDNELMNNYGTLFDLSQTVLKNSGWKVNPINIPNSNTEQLFEYQITSEAAAYELEYALDRNLFASLKNVISTIDPATAAINEDNTNISAAKALLKKYNRTIDDIVPTISVNDYIYFFYSDVEYVTVNNESYWQLKSTDEPIQVIYFNGKRIIGNDILEYDQQLDTDQDGLFVDEWYKYSFYTTISDSLTVNPRSGVFGKKLYKTYKHCVEPIMNKYVTINKPKLNKLVDINNTKQNPGYSDIEPISINTKIYSYEETDVKLSNLLKNYLTNTKNVTSNVGWSTRDAEDLNYLVPTVVYPNSVTLDFDKFKQSKNYIQLTNKGKMSYWNNGLAKSFESLQKDQEYIVRIKARPMKKESNGYTPDSPIDKSMNLSFDLIEKNIYKNLFDQIQAYDIEIPIGIPENGYNGYYISLIKNLISIKLYEDEQPLYKMVQELWTKYVQKGMNETTRADIKNGYKYIFDQLKTKLGERLITTKSYIYNPNGNEILKNYSEFIDDNDNDYIDNLNKLKQYISEKEANDYNVLYIKYKIGNFLRTALSDTQGTIKQSLNIALQTGTSYQYRKDFYQHILQLLNEQNITYKYVSYMYDGNGNPILLPFNYTWNDATHFYEYNETGWTALNSSTLMAQIQLLKDYCDHDYGEDLKKIKFDDNEIIGQSLIDGEKSLDFSEFDYFEDADFGTNGYPEDMDYRENDFFVKNCYYQYKIKLNKTIEQSYNTVYFILKSFDNNENYNWFIEDIQLIKYEHNGNEIFYPEDLIKPLSITKKHYYYVNSNNTAVELPNNDDYYIPIENQNFETIKHLDIKESNYFNIINSLAELFEVWVQFKISHYCDGRILLDENNHQVKTVQYSQYSPYDNYNWAGFKYGININNITRTVKSDTFATKVIVKNNNNEFAKGGSASISRAYDNPRADNVIYNFTYYANQGILPLSYLNEKYYNNLPLIKQYNELYMDYNNQYVQLYNSYDNSKLMVEELTAGLESAQKTIGEAEQQYNDYKEIFGTEDNENVQAKLQYLLSAYAQYNFVSQMLETQQLNVNQYKQQINGEYNSNIIYSLGSVSKQNGIWYFLDGAGYWQKLDFDKEDAKIKVENNNCLPLKLEYYEYLINKMNLEFYNEFSNYIQEATWTDDKYIDDNIYYQDAIKVANQNAFPKIEYKIDVVNLDSVDEYSKYTFKIGDRTYIEDVEFFGYATPLTLKQYGKTLFGSGNSPYKKEVIVSETQRNFNDPTKSTITIKTYKNEFDELFSKTTASVQTLQYNKSGYERATKLIDTNNIINQSILEKSLNQKAMLIASALNQSITIDTGSGLVATDTTNINNKVILNSYGIVLSSDGGDSWSTAISAEGINTNKLTAGEIATEKIRIFNKLGDVAFQWNENGINAYGDYISQESIQPAVRFNKFGLFGVHNINDFNYNVIDDIISNTIFSLSWKGIRFNSLTNEGIYKQLFNLDGENGSIIFGSEDNLGMSIKPDNYAFWAGSNSINHIPEFFVETNGIMYCQNISLNKQMIGQRLYLDTDGLFTFNQGKIGKLYVYDNAGLTKLHLLANETEGELYYQLPTTDDLDVTFRQGEQNNKLIIDAKPNPDYYSNLRTRWNTTEYINKLLNFNLKLDSGGVYLTNSHVKTYVYLINGIDDDATTYLLDYADSNVDNIIEDNTQINLSAIWLIKQSVQLKNNYVFRCEIVLDTDTSLTTLSLIDDSNPINLGGTRTSSENLVSEIALKEPQIDRRTEGKPIGTDDTYMFYASGTYGYDSSNNPQKYTTSIKSNGKFHADMTSLSSSPSITSDENLKHSIINLPQNYDLLFDNLQPRLYKYNNGFSDRYHVGFIAQEVYQAMEEAQIELQDFAGLTIDYNTDTGQELLWMLRYEEFIALNTAEIQKLKQRIAELESKFENL